MHAGGDEAGDVRHVHDHRRADGLRDGADAREVDHARVGAGADHDHLRLVLVRELLELLVVDSLVVLADAVGHDRVELAGEVERVAVREVAAVRQVHAEHRVAGREEREVHRHVRLRAGVRLDVGVLGAEERLGARDRERLGHVHEFAAAVIALPRISLGVLVGHHRANGLENGGADEVLRRNELEPLRLPARLVADGRGNLGIGVGERALHGGEGQFGHGKELSYRRGLRSSVYSGNQLVLRRP